MASDDDLRRRYPDLFASDEPGLADLVAGLDALASPYRRLDPPPALRHAIRQADHAAMPKSEPMAKPFAANETPPHPHTRSLTEWHEARRGRLRQGVEMVAGILALVLFAGLLVTLLGSRPAQPGAVGIVASPTATPTATPTGTAISNATSQTGCGITEAKVGPIVRDFIAAFNQGDQPALATFFPDDSAHGLSGVLHDQDTMLQAFVENRYDGAGIAQDTKDGLLAAFAGRHQQHAVWELRALKVSGGPDLLGSMVMTVEARADDMTPRTFEGKGLVNCDRHWITAWVMTDHVGLGPVSTPGVSQSTPQATPTALPLPDLASLPVDATSPSIGPLTGDVVSSVIYAFGKGDQAALAELFDSQTSLTYEENGKTISISGRSDVLAQLGLWEKSQQWELMRADIYSLEHGAAFHIRLTVRSNGAAPRTVDVQGTMRLVDGQVRIMSWQLRDVEEP